MDFAEHNRMVKTLWEGFNRGKAWRVPVIAGVSSRFILMDPALNPGGYSFQDYMELPECMLRVQLALERFKRFELDDDTEKGVPEDGWSVCVDFQNVYEAAWFGAEVVYTEGQVPRCRPFLTESNKYDFLKEPKPSPFSGIMGRAKSFFEYYDERRNEKLMEGVGLARIDGCPLWTDGPFTIACLLRGAENFALDIVEDPEYAHALLRYITDSVTDRIRAWRVWRSMPVRPASWGFADDMAQLLSVGMLRDFLLPCYQAMRRELSLPGSETWLHLCGNASRHMVFLRDLLNLTSLDTGFPMDFSTFAREIGPNVVWQGGPHVGLLLDGDPQTIGEEVRRILRAVMPHTRRFVLRDANDIAPQTPMNHVAAMVDAGRRYGIYPE